MASFLTGNQTKRRTRSSISSTESTSSPDTKKVKSFDVYPEETTQEDDEILIASNMPANELSEKMDEVLRKLSKLDTIEDTVNKIQNSLHNLEERTTKLEKVQDSTNDTISDLKSAMTFCSSDVSDLKKALEEATASKEVLTVKVQDLESKVEGLKTKDLYLEAYSRRENIKFLNIEEEEGEDVEEVLRSFLNAQLNYRDYNHVEIQRIHRNPSKKDPRRNNPRPILARFLRAKDCEEIMALGRNLKGSKYQMFVDLPNELVQRRRVQMNAFRTAKANRIPAAFSKAEPDKLYIRGQLWPIGKELII
ncbi:MAG: hypothetical protein DSY43_01280 [Gammaproteobacteria bacterium]|nr:MAG: hypothetical protein DSY43_01280 [Gammaproteobacteria bacterium]